MWTIFAIFDCLEPGSFHSKMAFFLELSIGKLQKCQKHNVFDAKSLQTVELPTGSSKYVQNRVLFRKHRILRNIIKHTCFFSWKLPWKWISGGHLSSELQDLFRLEMIAKTAFPHFSWSSSIKMAVSRKLSMEAIKTMGALKGGGQLRVHWSFYLRGRYGHR